MTAPGVLGNDSDADGDVLNTVLVNSPGHGTLTLGADGSFTYRPSSNYHGTDSFTYNSYDGKAYGNTATVVLTINPVNDAPIAKNDSATTRQGTPVTVNVLANDTDVEGNVLSVTGLTQPANGTVTLNADSTVTYVPSTGFSGTDTFTYTVNDGLVAGNSAIVTITVQKVATAETNITMSKQLLSRWWRATAVVSVGSSGSPLAGAKVYGQWSGLYNVSASATTDANGKVSFKTNYITNRGTVTFTITRIVKNGQNYTLSGELIDSISGP